MKKYDVIIAGAGPSGLNTARLLADQGMDVLVVEKKPQVGSGVVCTGIVGHDFFTRFKLPSGSILNRIQEVDLYSPGLMKLTYRHPFPFACVLNRGQFDKDLAEEAESRGVAIQTGCEIKDIRVFSEEVRVSVLMKEEESRWLKGRMLVLATGNDFRLHKRLQLGRPREFLNAAQVELEAEQHRRTEVWVGNETAPGGFAWLVPAGPGKVRAGLLTKAPPLSYMNRFLMKRLQLNDNGIKGAERRVKTIAQGPASPTFSRRVISVGEAAAQVKTTTGGGVFLGLFCSEIAAGAIVRGIKENRMEAADLAEYEKGWRKAIQKELAVGYYTRKICSRLKDRDVEKLFQIARDDGVFPLIKETARFDWQKDIILALARKATVHSLRALPRLFG